MKKNFLSIIIFLFATSFIFSSCKKDAVEENEEELITTMVLSFTPTTGGTTLSYQYDDPDGPGGIAPTKQEIVLAASTTYNVSLQLLNKTETPPDDITVEVQNESAAHRFYYEPSAGSNIAISGLNKDVNGIPLGTTSTWSTGSAATGTVKVVLRHYPGTPPDKAITDPINSPKSNTDIEVLFSTKIQ